MQKAFTIRLAMIAVAALAAAQSLSAGPVVEACASDPKVLGLSRIVEIDTKGGPQFGGGHTANDFLADHEVVLTFDDGPSRSYTRAVLKALSEHCTKATFFMVGRMAATDPAMVKEVAAQGHTVASHTNSHQNLKAIGLLKGRKEFEMGIAAVTKANGGPIAPFFRFPFLSESRPVIEHAKSRNVGVFSIDIDSKDFLTRSGDEVQRRVMSQLAVHKKGIILMHDIQPSTAHGLKGLLDDLHKKGFKVVHMVPKASLDSIANFDASTTQDSKVEHGNKAEPVTAAAVKRAIEPTVSPPAEEVAKAPTVASPTVTAPLAAKAVPEVLPWQAQATKKQLEAAQKPKRIARPKIDDLPWQLNVFRN